MKVSRELKQLDQRKKEKKKGGGVHMPVTQTLPLYIKIPRERKQKS